MIYFSELIDVCILIKKSKKIEDKVNYLYNLFTDCSIKEIEIFYQIFINKKHNNKLINNNYFIKSIKSIYFLDNSNIKKYLIDNKTIESIYLYLVGSEREKLKKKYNQLTLIQFSFFINKFKNISGENSILKKISYLRSFLLFIDQNESYYIIKILLNQFNIGIGDSFFYKFLSKKYNITIKNIENIFSKTNDILEILNILNEKNTNIIEKYSIKLFNPIKFMLASIQPKNLEDIFLKSKKWVVEYKYDGIRIQIHKKNNDIKIYSRNLDDITLSIPDATSSIREYIHENNIILDAEAVAINKNGIILPFQDILKRSKRKYNINSIINDINIKINIFDILYLNGESLIDIYLEKRRLILETCNIKKSKFINVDPYFFVEDTLTINKIYNIAINSGYEGIMIKNPLSKYISGRLKNQWIKKKKYETLDLIVTGGILGVGKRENKVGSFILSCWDSSYSYLIEICKVGTGINNENIEIFTKKFIHIKNNLSDKIILKNPNIIFEIGFDKITKNNKNNKYSLRFPRIINIRYDKSIIDADSIDKIIKIYNNQKSILIE